MRYGVCEEKRNACGGFVGNLEEGDHLEDTGIQWQVAGWVYFTQDGTSGGPT